MAQIPAPEYGVYQTVTSALATLKPIERVMVMDWVKECYCPNCGYPAPPSDEPCVGCAENVHS